MNKFIYPTLGFLLYVQFSPKMGKVWWRNRHFTPMGAVKLMIYPFQTKEIWNPSVWDINYLVWLSGGYIIEKVVSNFPTFSGFC